MPPTRICLDQRAISRCSMAVLRRNRTEEAWILGEASSPLIGRFEVAEVD